MRIEISYDVDRPVADAFQFYARDHVRNHPRWDPDIDLELVGEGPIGVGSVIERRNRHFETPLEGTMQVVEFEPDRTMAVLINEDNRETYSRVTFEPAGSDRTTITVVTTMPWLEDCEENRDLLTSLMERSASNIKDLIEAEG